MLNEVKYAINNLSTPSHAHDEAILQKETEKVNDRILMLSFIAMAVSAIGMMRSNDISILFKTISGFAIFSLPIIYYLVRSSQKKISKRTFQIALRPRIRKGLEIKPLWPNPLLTGVVCRVVCGMVF